MISLISDIDRFDAEWQAIERREGQSLKELKAIATVRSVGASTRIEGSKLSDEEVDVLLKNLDISKLEERDKQEVVGYFEVLDTISEAFEDIQISENGIKGLHNHLLRHSTKDQWHKGDYKKQSNSVEAQMPDGTSQIIFRTTDPGFATEDAMREMITWYGNDNETHALVKCALLCYEFVSIHPFQDGNGRLSRLLATLLLRKHHYHWIQYVSLEHEIEHQKNEYYRVLRSCQANRPNEDITEWVLFFLSCLKNVHASLMNKLEMHGTVQQLSKREKLILVLVETYPGIQSGAITEKLDINVSSVKRALADLLEKRLIEKDGVGRGTSYYIL